MVYCVFRPSQLALMLNRGLCLAVCITLIGLNVPGLIRWVGVLYVYWVYKRLIVPRVLLRRPASVRRLHCTLDASKAPVTRVEFASGDWASVRVLGVDCAGLITLTCQCASDSTPNRVFKIRVWPDTLAAPARALFNAWVRLVWLPQLMR